MVVSFMDSATLEFHGVRHKWKISGWTCCLHGSLLHLFYFNQSIMARKVLAHKRHTGSAYYCSTHLTCGEAPLHETNQLHALSSSLHHKNLAQALSIDGHVK